MRVVINGAGVGGLALAAGLARRQAAGADLEVHLFERAPELRVAGAGIVLAPNAQRALADVGVAATGRPFPGFALTDAGGRPLARAVGTDAPSLACHRRTLLARLRAAVPEHWLHFGASVVGVEPGGARLADGQRVPADVVVGADGIGSSVRAALGGPGPVDAGYVCWRAVVPRVASAPAAPEERWGVGARLGLVPLPDDTVYVYLCATHRVGAPLPTTDAVIAGFGDDARRLVGPETVWRMDRIAEHRQHRWHEGSVALIGDASHALTPNLGQGAAMALEDAATLARALSGGAVDSALAEWARRRRARVRWVAARSRTLGRVGQWTSPLACRVRNWGLGLTPAFAMRAPARRLADWTPGPQAIEPVRR